MSYKLKVTNWHYRNFDRCLFAQSFSRKVYVHAGGDFHYLHGTNGMWYLYELRVDVGDFNLSGYSARLTLTLKDQLDNFKR